jgi:multisubunit Na+/H+ antiporter MnhB subunit
MSGRHARDGPTLAERLVQRRRRAMWIVVLGVVVTVLGAAGLVLTEPVTTSGSNQLRGWAVGVVIVGLVVIVTALISRAAPIAEQRSSRPSRPAWLLLVAAGFGVATLIATARLGSEDPLRYLSPALLTVYPLAIYAYQRRRYRRAMARDPSGGTLP